MKNKIHFRILSMKNVMKCQNLSIKNVMRYLILYKKYDNIVVGD